MAPRREQKKRMGKKHRQASTRPKLGKGPAKGARKGSATTGAAAPKQRKKLASKRAAEEKAKRTPARSPEFEHRIIVGNDEPGESKKKQVPLGNYIKKGNGKNKGEKQVLRSAQDDKSRAEQDRLEGVTKGDSKRKRRGAAAKANEPGADRETASFSADLGHRRVSASQELEGLPLVAICGRPNVGKSTLFNRLTGTRRSIVGDEPGITRDRIYGEVEWAGRTVRLVDTGGVVPDDEALIPSEIFRQARVALEEADVIVMVVDGRTELAAPDNELARLLLRGGKPVFLAVNKMDAAELEAAAENFRTLGFRNTFAVSAEHGSGIGDLLDEVWAKLPPEALAEEPTEYMEGIGDEMEEDEGDALADRATLVPRAMREAELEGEAATADEPAGVDEPPVGEPDVEAPRKRRSASGAIQGSLHSARRAPVEMTEFGEGADEEQGPEPARERNLRSHGEHVSRETKIAIIGRPNVGKSTLLNALTGTDRAIVSPIAGTTRDAVDEVVTRDGHDFRFVDTAGIRRKGKTKLMAEKLSVIMSLKHLEAADVALLIIDATEGVTGSDATIGGYAHESGRSVIIVVNKWDLMAPPKSKRRADGMREFDGKPPADKKVFEEQVRDNLKYLDYAPIVFVSAAEGKNIGEVFKKVELVARERRKRITTGNMNRFLDKVDFGRASVPMNKRVRIYYMTQAAVAPPTFVLFTDRDVKLHFSYERFLSNEIRKAFKFIGSPIWFKVKARNKKKEE